MRINIANPKIMTPIGLLGSIINIDSAAFKEWKWKGNNIDSYTLSVCLRKLIEIDLYHKGLFGVQKKFDSQYS